MLIFPETAFPRTLGRLLAEFCCNEARGLRLEAWLFEDADNRRAAEERLAAQGVDALLRSAYKPLLHAFQEEFDCTSAVSILVRYPVSDEAGANRFLLETYPLAALVGEADLRFLPGTKESFTYEVEIRHRGGRLEKVEVFAPNRSQPNANGHVQLSPTGWLRLTGPDGRTLRDERLETDVEALFARALNVVTDFDWGSSEPYFGELNLQVTLPVADTPLAYGEEVISLMEGLHEDLYFSALEIFGSKAGHRMEGRRLRPGQIVPEVTFRPGAPSLAIETRPLDVLDRVVLDEPLATARTPLGADQIARELAAIGGQVFTARTRAGRQVEGRYVSGLDRAAMISGGQHANETSGIVGALRAAHVLMDRPDAHFAVMPLENPDGYALHHRLRKANPRHMFHAARYTAFGDDLEYRDSDDPNERAIRVPARQFSKALLHISLHGYPAHEWTRPFSGYVPAGFEGWTIPKGFFLILRHDPSWAMEAEELLSLTTHQLAGMPDLMAFNDRQIKIYELHAGPSGFRFVNGFPCLVIAEEGRDTPMTLIAEYPDETIGGDALVAAHTAQTRTVLAAYDALQRIRLAPLT